jgi:PAS domain S-box-containing protein
MPADDLTEDALPPEERERQAGWRRGQEREADRQAGREDLRAPNAGLAPPTAAARAFAALAENVRDYAIFLMDPAGVITFWGEGARLIKWWTKDEAEGAHLRLLYPAGGSNDGTAEEHLRLAAERGEYTGEGLRVRSDRSTFWAGITLTALWSEDGTLLGFAKVTRDLTARRAADALLQAAATASDEARRAAESASTAKSQFLATVSHEIRTPLNAIIGYVDLVMQEIAGPLTGQQRAFLVATGKASRHLLTLIDEVLDLSRLEVDHNAVSRAVVRVGDAVTHALQLVAPQAHAKGLALTDAVSGYAAGLAVWGDKSRMEQILVNLLANAVKFTTPTDAEPARITVSAGSATSPSPDARVTGEGPWVYVRVEDTGSGIAADRLSAIFEPFVQADMTLTRTHGGVGLGLAISRQLARLMQGDVTARSELGLGSSFFLWLPAAPVASLVTGGLPGHGPYGEAEPSRIEAAVSNPAAAPGRVARPLREMSDLVLAEIEPVLHAYVARLRSDPETPSARELDDTQIEDHLASFLADVADTLQFVDIPAGAPNDAVRDSSAIQRTIAERHGAQRARLGWSEREVSRDFAILREELEAAVYRQAPHRLPGPDAAARQGAAERAFELLTQVVAIAEQHSLQSFRHALAG